MTSFFISFDNEDDSLGDYFTKCKHDLEEFLNECNQEFTIKFLSSRQCTSAYIERILFAPPKSFLFITYGHGNRNSITGRYGEYIRVEVNTHAFAGSFFYSNACLCGSNLADRLIADGTLAFLGYTSEVYSLKEEYEDVSIKCDNSGLQAFISEDITVLEALEKMKSYYTFQINRIHSNRDPLRAGLLTFARESLILKGNQDLRFSELGN